MTWVEANGDRAKVYEIFGTQDSGMCSLVWNGMRIAGQVPKPSAFTRDGRIAIARFKMEKITDNYHFTTK